jgi:hypothetical protein
MKPTCESCRWWHHPKSQCRRHAPHAVTCGSIQLPSWVHTAFDDWCGEFEHKPKKCEAADFEERDI